MAVLVLALAVAACGGGKKLHPYQEPVAQKPDPEVSVVEDLQKIWKIDVGGGDRIGYTNLRPAVVDDAIFFADPNGDVVRIDAETGSTVWQVRLDSDINAGVGSDGGLVVVGLV
ncbi:MAG: PQQ-binding-like beta-propeller repeat protein, partial [Pseudomonadota bacterium]|nr:PQQ-binding-like beta-propeller repeat protein [Pseudomonadota bacterium]